MLVEGLLVARVRAEDVSEPDLAETVLRPVRMAKVLADPGVPTRMAPIEGPGRNPSSLE